MNMYATELGDAGSDVLDILNTVQGAVKKVTDIATDPFGNSQEGQPTAGNQQSNTSGSYSANLPTDYKKTVEEIANNTGIVSKDQQTTDTTETDTDTNTTTESSDLDVGGFLKRNLKPRPLPAVVGVGVGGYTYYKTKKVIRSVGFGLAAMFVGNFIQERVELSRAGGN